MYSHMETWTFSFQFNYLLLVKLSLLPLSMYNALGFQVQATGV